MVYALLGITLAAVPAFASLLLNPAVVDPARFRVTTFASGAPFAYSMQPAADGSLLVTAATAPFGPGRLLRYVDADRNGIADGPGTVVYSSNTGPFTGLVKVGDLYAIGNFGDKTITLLQPGATAASPMTPVGSINFNYGDPDYWHPTFGFTSRPVAGQPGTYEFTFNVGSSRDAALTGATVGLSGLVNGTVDEASLYSVQIDVSGQTPVASNLRKVAAGIRNSAGLAFDSASGDLWFADNGIDGIGMDPPQADELNRISAGDFGTAVPNFGFPDCYIQYSTGAQVGSGCVLPEAAFRPIPPDTANDQSEGTVEIAFSPAGFPAPFNNGIFVAFAGTGGNNPQENPLVFYNRDTDTYVHFVEAQTPGIRRLGGLLATDDSLFVTDFSAGVVYQIQANPVPEPGTVAMAAIGLSALLLRRFRG